MKSLLVRLLLVVAAAVLPAVAFQAYSELEARHTRQQLMEDEALRLIQMVSLEEQKIIEGAEQVLDVIASAPAVRRGIPDLCQSLLSDLIATSSRYSTATVIDLTGHIACAPDPASIGIDVSDRAYFRDALRTGGTVTGEYTISRTNGKQTVAVAKPFKDRDGAVAGVVHVAISLLWLSEQLARLPLPPGATARIADRNGIILARYAEASRFVGTPIPKENRFTLEGDKIGVVTGSYNGLDGRPFIAGYAPPGAVPNGLAVGIGLDPETTFATVTRANRMGLWLIIAGAVLALLTAALLGARLIRRPVEQLLVVADRWRAGDLTVRSGLHKDDGEFGSLGAAFDSMAAALGTREHALRESEALLRSVLEQIPVAVAIFRPPEGTPAIRSRYYETLLGPTQEQTSQGKPTTPRHAAEHADGRPYAVEENPSWRALYCGETIMAEPLLCRRSDGRLLELESYAAPILDADGTAVAAVTANFDVTERNQTKRELAQSNVALEVRVAEEIAAREAAQVRAAQAEKLAALGQLAGGIAHDFNNVLQAVVGAASLIEGRTEIEGGIRRLARLALKAADRGASITRRLLAFGHRSNLQPEEVDATAVLNNLREVLAHTLGAGIEVQVKPAADRLVLIADKGQLETALVNLATNARDAMPRGGQLVMSTGTDIVSAEGPPHPAGLEYGRYVRITIADTGAGMDKRTLKRATEPFFTTKGVGVGTGLGLSMVQGFAEQSGGGLNIASVPGKGTIVTLWLPQAAAASPILSLTLNEDEPVADEPLHSRGEQLARAVVLVVDDEDMIREMLAEQLEERGFRVLTAANGDEALVRLAADETIDVLVTDLSMPGMDGLAVIRAAQARCPGLPAVLLTGYAENDAALAVSGAVSGSFSLLRKPLRADQLVDRIESLLARRADVSQ